MKLPETPSSAAGTEDALARRLHAVPDVAEILREVLKPGDVFVDVGAKNGVATTLVAAPVVGTTGRVIAIEPQPQRFARLLHNVALNRAANALCFPVAASDESIFATLYRDLPTAAEGVGRSIRVQRIDSLCRKIGCPKVDLVKIDAPGSELLVLRGMKRLLEQPQPPAILCLVSKWVPDQVKEARAELVGFMKGFGYDAHQIGPTLFSRLPGQPAYVRFMLWLSPVAVAARSKDHQHKLKTV